MNPAEILAAGIVALGLDLPPDTQAKLLAYLALLVKWNRIYNLTAVRREEDMVTQHLLDSLAVLPYLEATRLADVGSGAGLPGLVLAIARPQLEVVSIESNQKKSAFQQQARIELGLANVAVHCGRVEALNPAAPLDAVISRAFSDLALFVRSAGHLVRAGGSLLAMKGVLPAAELAALPAGWRLAAAHPLAVPGLAAQRHLIVLGRN